MSTRHGRATPHLLGLALIPARPCFVAAECAEAPLPIAMARDMAADRARAEPATWSAEMERLFAIDDPREEARLRDLRARPYY